MRRFALLPEPSASATRSSTTGKDRLTPGRWTKALIDYVARTTSTPGQPSATANVATEIQVGEQDRRRNHRRETGQPERLGGSGNVATGYRHRVPPLGLGPERHRSGAGNRPATDYAQGKDCTGGHYDRRAAYPVKAVIRPAGQRPRIHGRLSGKPASPTTTRAKLESGRWIPACADVLRHGQPVPRQASARGRMKVALRPTPPRRARLLQRRHPPHPVLQRRASATSHLEQAHRRRRGQGPQPGPPGRPGRRPPGRPGRLPRPSCRPRRQRREGWRALRPDDPRTDKVGQRRSRRHRRPGQTDRRPQAAGS